MTESRAPVALPGYTLGDEGRPTHFTATIPRETAALEAKELAVGDAAFILRSGHKWAYAIVIEREETDGTTLRFEVDTGKNRKTFPEAVWGKYIRVIKADASEIVKLEAEAGERDKARMEAAEPKQDAKKESKSATLVLGEFSSELGSWFSSKWNSKTTKENKPTAVASDNKDDNVPPSLSLESTKASQSLELEDKAATVTTTEQSKTKQIGLLFSSIFPSTCGKLEEQTEASKDEEGEIVEPEASPAATKEESESKPKLEEPKAAPKIEEGETATPEAAEAATKEESESTPKLEEPEAAPKDEEGDIAEPAAAPATTKEESEPTTALEEPEAAPKNEEAETAKPKPVTAATTKEKSKKKSMLKGMFSKKKKDEAKAAAVTTTDKETSKTQTEESAPAQTKTEKIDESEPTATAASPGTSTDENKSPAPGKAPEAAVPKPIPQPDETRDATEEKDGLAPTAPAEKTPVEGDAPPSPAVPVAAPPAPEPEPPKPIKLLKTPFKFYKARSMKEDPAAAALAATSFADEHEGYGAIQSDGVIVCKHDPAAAANAEILAQERMCGDRNKNVVSVVESDAELKRQGVVIVEAE